MSAPFCLEFCKHFYDHVTRLYEDNKITSLHYNLHPQCSFPIILYRIILSIKHTTRMRFRFARLFIKLDLNAILIFILYTTYTPIVVAADIMNEKRVKKNK